MDPSLRVLTASGKWRKNDLLGCPGLATGFVVFKTAEVIPCWRLRDGDVNVLRVTAGEAGWGQQIPAGAGAGGWRGGTALAQDAIENQG